MRKYLEASWSWIRLRSRRKRGTAAVRLVPLTPQYDSDRHAVYFNALDVALSSANGLVLNVALTGSYGVGKSSILAEIARRHKRRVISISLSTLGFIGSDTDAPAPKDTSKEKTNGIQKEIVKQLLYSQDPVKMPGSRYRRMTRFRFWREVGLASLFAIPITLLSYLSTWTDSFAEALPLPHGLHLMIHGIVFVSTSLLILGFRSVFHNRIQIDSVTAGTATIALSAKSTTYFDEYLDEMVYFFEVSRCNIVIFEDIDRFEEPYIFETLRSLNSILNSAKQLKRRRIKFVYAIKDSIFDELGARSAVAEIGGSDNEDAAKAELARANRTKFFDLVIPVVPFVTHRTARDLVIGTMKDVFPAVSAELVDLAARYVADMRLIKNIRNEYAIFEHQVIISGDLALERNKLFAMMIYKSTHLSDFERIRVGESNLDKLYHSGRKLVATNLRSLSTEIRTARAELRRLRASVSSDRSESLGELLAVHLKSRVLDLEGQRILELRVGDYQAKPADLTGPPFWEKLASTVEDLTVVYEHPRTYGGRTFTIDRTELTRVMGESIRSQTWVETDRKRLRDIVKSASSQHEFLKRADMGELMKRSDFVVEEGGGRHSFMQLAQKYLESELAIKLVGAGYIDQNYTLYTSTYHGARISANATNFILKNVDHNHMDAFYKLSVSEVEAIVREKGQILVESRACYNINILDWALEKSIRVTDSVIERVVEYGDKELEFLQSYFEDGSRSELLVHQLCARSGRIFSLLIGDIEVDDGDRLKLVNAALLAMDDEMDYQVDTRIGDYFAANYSDLDALTSEGTTESQAVLISKLIASSGCKLESLSPLGANVRAAIVQAQAYNLSRSNLCLALGGDEPDLSLDAIYEQSQVVYQFVLSDLAGYLLALSADEATVVSGVALARFVRDISEANREHLEAVISRAHPDCNIGEIVGVPIETWPALAEGICFSGTYDNVRAYIHEYGVDAGLASVLMRTGIVDVEEGVAEEAKQAVALAILGSRNELPSVETRVALAAALRLGSFIPATVVPRESGNLIGLLIANGLVADDAETFGLFELEDVAGLAFAISKSEAIVDFMSAELVSPVVGELISSAVVPVHVKDVIVEEFSTYTAGAPRRSLTVVADYARSRGKTLVFDDVVRLAQDRVDAKIVLEQLQPHLKALSMSELAPVLMTLGGKYRKLSAANGTHPTIPATAANRDLVDRLLSLNVASSVDDLGAELRVHMKRP